MDIELGLLLIDLFQLILLGSIGFCWYWVFVLLPQKRWEKWPTVEQYMAELNPSKGKGISCYKCGSHNIWEESAKRNYSKMRIHYCKQCNTGLYRTYIS